MIEIIKAAFAAGEVKTFLIQGEYLEILEAAYPIDVAMLDRSGAQLSVMRNAEASYYSRPGRYEVVQVTSSQAQTVRIFVGSGDAGTRKTSGDVSVIDGAKAVTAANRAGIGYIDCPATTAMYSYVQVWNPVGSNKNIFIEKLSMSSETGAGIISMRSSTIALANVYASFPSKKWGQVVDLAERHYEASAAILGGGLYNEQIPAAYQAVVREFAKPLMLAPGVGMMLRGGGVNYQIAASVEMFTEDL